MLDRRRRNATFTACCELRFCGAGLAPFWPYHFVRVFDTPHPGRYAPTIDTLNAWLNHDDRPPPPALAASPITIYENRAKSFAYRALQNARLPRLLAGGLVAADLPHFPPPRCKYSDRLILGDCWSVNHTMSAGGLAAIGIQTEYIAWKAIIHGKVDDDLDETSVAARDSRVMSAWLDAITAGAEQVVRLDGGLRLWLTRLDELSAEPRQSLAFRKIALFVAARPSATIAEAAKRFKLSRQTATRLFTVATEHAMFRVADQREILQALHCRAIVRRFLPIIARISVSYPMDSNRLSHIH